MSLQSASVAILMVCWVAYGIVFSANAVKIQRSRRLNPGSESQRQSMPRANAGLLLEALGFFFAFFRRPTGDTVSPALLICGIILAPLSLMLGWMAVRELGIQWRIQAVVTQQHKLITTGPYSFVRHPVYTSLLGMLLATGFIVSSWKLTLLGVLVYIVGTEIRIAAEEKLLEGKFGKEFTDFRAGVRGYIPFVR